MMIVIGVLIRRFIGAVFDILNAKRRNREREALAEVAEESGGGTESAPATEDGDTPAPGSPPSEDDHSGSESDEEPSPDEAPPKRGIPASEFRRVADRLGVTPAHIRAVDEVESSGSGFLRSGDPKILFEAHVFARLTGDIYNRSHPGLSSESWDRSLYVGGQGEHDRLGRAAALDREAALQSASWGRYQVMGFNWRKCGYNSLQGFVNAMYRSETDHLNAFAGFIEHTGLAEPLRAEDWAAFALTYNGPGYRENRYDERMRDAFRRHSAGA